MFNIAVMSIQHAFNKAMYSKRDMSKEGRINEFLVTGIDNIIGGLEGISCEYNDENKHMYSEYVQEKIMRIKNGVEDLEKLVEVLKND